MIFYGLKTCDTCRKAQKELRAAGIDFTYVDVRADGLQADKIASWTAKLGYKPLLNTRSTTWRALSDAEKADIDEHKAVRLMAENPTLIKRPVIELGGHILVGWTAETKTALGL